MFLPSVAERHRRAVFLSVGVTVLLAQAVVRVAPLERLARAVTAPVAQVTMPLSAWVLGRVAPDAGLALPPAPAGDALIQAERDSGQPAAVPGVAWLEVPVGRVDRSRGKLLLAAGADFGLAPGMPVVFGTQWLGRVGETGARTAEVELASGAARRTPVLFAGDRGELMRAVLEGRGGDARPLVRFLEAKGDPVEGAPALFRRGAEDPPAYAALEMDVGALLRVGDPERGTAAWEVDFELPAGAEGRVFVGAGAVSASVVAEPPVVRGPATLALRSDAVFGPRVCALRTDPSLPATVAMVGNRVLGAVVARRGDQVWCSLRPPANWPTATWVGLDANTATREDAALRFTRGGDGIPRGLFLGDRSDPRPHPRGALQVVGRVPLEEPDA